MCVFIFFSFLSYFRVLFSSPRHPETFIPAAAEKPLWILFDPSSSDIAPMSCPLNVLIGKTNYFPFSFLPSPF